VDGPLIMCAVRAPGVDENGKEYIEASRACGGVSLGFGEKRLAEAAKAQMEKLSYYHLFNSKSHEPAIELAERLLPL